jgi:hypothetical protein
VTFVILFVLAVVWAVYLASWLRNRSEHKSVNSISSFNRHLSVLERATPNSRPPSGIRPSSSTQFPAFAPVRRHGMSLSTARRRRRDVLFVLAGTAVVTLLLAVIVGGMFVPLQLLADLLLVGYLALLFQSQRRAPRRSNVTYLGPAVQAQPEPAYLLASSGSRGY